jgi:hypothetical protein
MHEHGRYKENSKQVRRECVVGVVAGVARRVFLGSKGPAGEASLNQDGPEPLQSRRNWSLSIHKGTSNPQKKSITHQQSYVPNMCTNSPHCILQGKGAAQDSTGTNRGGSSSVRPSQASLLTQLNESILDRYLYSKWYCCVGFLFICAMPGSPHICRTG